MSKEGAISPYFDRVEEAQATLAALQNLWKKVEGTVMVSPQTRILNIAETVDL